SGAQQEISGGRSAKGRTLPARLGGNRNRKAGDTVLEGGRVRVPLRLSESRPQHSRSVDIPGAQQSAGAALPRDDLHLLRNERDDGPAFGAADATRQNRSADPARLLQRNARAPRELRLQPRPRLRKPASSTRGAR